MVTRRNKVNVRDWLFVGVMVGALGVTASLLLSYRNSHGTKTQRTEATNVEHEVNAPRESGANSVDTSASDETGAFTQIVSTPPGAEVVASGAVIGNTPVRVPRTSTNTDYLVRMAGHEPQLVRVMPSSPETVSITLNKLGAPAPAPAQ